MAQRSTPRSWVRSLGKSRAGQQNRVPSGVRPITADEGRRRGGMLGVVVGVAMAALAWPSVVLADPLYYVEVGSTSEQELATVRTKVSDAYIVTKPDGTKSILAGIFSSEANARQLVADLQALNVSSPSMTALESDPEEDSRNDTSASDPPATTAAANSAADTSDRQTTAENSPSSRRDYATLVTVPTDIQPANALKDIRHLFPQASLQTYEGQPAIQTGTFSNRSQAQLQADWLASQDLRAIAVPSDRLNQAGGHRCGTLCCPPSPYPIPCSNSL